MLFMEACHHAYHCKLNCATWTPLPLYYVSYSLLILVNFVYYYINHRSWSTDWLSMFKERLPPFPKDLRPLSVFLLYSNLLCKAVSTKHVSRSSFWDSIHHISYILYSANTLLRIVWEMVRLTKPCHGSGWVSLTHGCTGLFYQHWTMFISRFNFHHISWIPNHQMSTDFGIKYISCYIWYM